MLLCASLLLVGVHSISGLGGNSHGERSNKTVSHLPNAGTNDVVHKSQTLIQLQATSLQNESFSGQRWHQHEHEVLQQSRSFLNHRRKDQTDLHTKGVDKGTPTTDAGLMPEHFSLFVLLFGEPNFKYCGEGDIIGTPCTGGFIVSVLVMAWTFKNLKVMSDVYFVPAIMTISKKLDLAPDVAGATLLAFGSSAPELSVNVVATFFIVNESGVGDIVGSAIHNILLIVGVAGAFAGRDLSLWWYPLSRDTIFFLVSITELVIFMWDGNIYAWEAGVLVGTYFIYIGWMVFNVQLHGAICSVVGLQDEPPEDGDDEDDDEEGMCWWDPVELFWVWTMPSPKTNATLCFLFALVHIALTTYIMVDAAHYFGIVVGIPSLFMGLVFLAAGTSIPDAFGSLAAARKGEADMAVSNALGSNIFDMQLGLGLPWLISALIGNPFVFRGVGRLLYWMAVLLGCLLLFYIAVIMNKWRLNVKMGCVLIAMYAGYVIWALLQSLSIVPIIVSYRR